MDKSPNKPWPLEEMRAYFLNADTWSFISHRGDPCPVPGCMILVRRGPLCGFHENLLPVSVIVRGIPVDEFEFEGELLVVEHDPLTRRIAIAVASERAHQRVAGTPL
jgi:hypothetical protein